MATIKASVPEDADAVFGLAVVGDAALKAFDFGAEDEVL